MAEVRLQKFLARAGVASRRASEALITSGRVSVNGEVVGELGTKVDPENDTIMLDGAAVELPTQKVVLKLNKPAGYLSAMSDDHGGRCVSELVPTAEFAGLFPVGRLDKDTTGLLLFTNDGELGNALIHPRHHVGKTYRAWVEGTVNGEELKQLREGVVLEDGITSPAQARVIKCTSNKTLLELTIYEGRNRQIRRMSSAVGHPVLELERIALGPIKLGSLKSGAWRELSVEEQHALVDASGLSRDRMELRTEDVQ